MRKSLRVTIAEKNRDEGKTFLLTEMASADSTDWGLQAMWLLMQSGAEFSPELVSQGIKGIAAMGLPALRGIPYAQAKPLLDRLLSCVEYVARSGGTETVRSLTPDDIEEMGTRLSLMVQVFGLHVDFSKAVANLNSANGEAAPDGITPST